MKPPVFVKKMAISIIRTSQTILTWSSISVITGTTVLVHTETDQHNRYILSYKIWCILEDLFFGHLCVVSTKIGAICAPANWLRVWSATTPFVSNKPIWILMNTVFKVKLMHLENGHAAQIQYTSNVRSPEKQVCFSVRSTYSICLILYK